MEPPQKKQRLFDFHPLNVIEDKVISFANFLEIPTDSLTTEEIVVSLFKIEYLAKLWDHFKQDYRTVFLAMFFTLQTKWDSMSPETHAEVTCDLVKLCKSNIPSLQEIRFDLLRLISGKQWEWFKSYNIFDILLDIMEDLLQEGSTPIGSLWPELMQGWPIEFYKSVTKDQVGRLIEITKRLSLDPANQKIDVWSVWLKLILIEFAIAITETPGSHYYTKTNWKFIVDSTINNLCQRSYLRPSRFSELTKDKVERYLDPFDEILNPFVCFISACNLIALDDVELFSELSSLALQELSHIKLGDPLRLRACWILGGFLDKVMFRDAPDFLHYKPQLWEIYSNDSDMVLKELSLWLLGFLKPDVKFWKECCNVMSHSTEHSFALSLKALRHFGSVTHKEFNEIPDDLRHLVVKSLLEFTFRFPLHLPIKLMEYCFECIVKWNPSYIIKRNTIPDLMKYWDAAVRSPFPLHKVCSLKEFCMRRIITNDNWRNRYKYSKLPDGLIDELSDYKRSSLLLRGSFINGIIAVIKDIFSIVDQDDKIYYDPHKILERLIDLEDIFPQLIPNRFSGIKHVLRSFTIRPMIIIKTFELLKNYVTDELDDSDQLYDENLAKAQKALSVIGSCCSVSFSPRVYQYFKKNIVSNALKWAQTRNLEYWGLKLTTNYSFCKDESMVKDNIDLVRTLLYKSWVNAIELNAPYLIKSLCVRFNEYAHCVGDLDVAREETDKFIEFISPKLTTEILQSVRAKLVTEVLCFATPGKFDTVFGD